MLIRRRLDEVTMFTRLRPGGAGCALGCSCGCVRVALVEHWDAHAGASEWRWLSTGLLTWVRPSGAGASEWRWLSTGLLARVRPCGVGCGAGASVWCWLGTGMLMQVRLCGAGCCALGCLYGCVRAAPVLHWSVHAGASV